MEKYDIFENSPLFLDGRVLTASFIPIAEDDSIFGLCILCDISRQFKAEKHQKELDNALKLVKKMDAMSCMAGGLAHDFNNLLSVICGNLDIVTLFGKKQGSEEQKKLLEQTKKAALVVVDLTRQISCFSNFGIMSRDNINVQDFVRKTVGDFFKYDKDQYTVNVTCKDGLTHADPETLGMAIVNVLQNGVEASFGKRLKIIIAENEFTTPQLMSGQYVPAGKYSRIDVCDLGRGISSEQLFQIFDPYFSTKERGALKGMGLGLTVVYAILRNHGGHVVVSSKSEQGTTVSLYLPTLIVDHTKLDALEELPKVKPWVLLLEPDEQMAEIGELMLGYLGFSVKVVSNRAEAIHMLKQFTNDPLSPRPLVIIALSRPQGESAVESCRLLHEIDPDIKVIAMSGTILDPVMENCRKYGFTHTLPKPFSMDSLKHITDTVLYT
jgi:CheY-like chemotaxis protein